MGKEIWSLIDRGSHPLLFKMFHLFLIQLLSPYNHQPMSNESDHTVKEIPTKRLKVYSRKNRPEPQPAPGTSPSDLPNPEPALGTQVFVPSCTQVFDISDLDILVALRKGKRTCPTRYPIQIFVSYHSLSLVYRAFVLQLSSEHIPDLLVLH